MSKKTFVYSHMHIPNLKRFIVWLSIFALSMIIVVLFQGILLINANNRDIKLDLLETISGIACIVIGLVFILFMILTISKNIAYIKKIKRDANCEVASFNFNFADKNSFGYFCRLFEYIMLAVTTIFVIGVTTYAIFNYIFYNSINYYLPICFLLLVSNNYACKSIEHLYSLQWSND